MDGDDVEVPRKSSIGKIVLGLVLIALILALIWVERFPFFQAWRRLTLPTAAVDGGLACLNPMDDTVRTFVESVKQQMADPDSFSHIHTYFFPGVDGAGNVVIMKYRERNSQGGMEFAAAAGVIDAQTCAVQVADQGHDGSAQKAADLIHDDQLPTQTLQWAVLPLIAKRLIDAGPDGTGTTAFDDVRALVTHSQASEAQN